MLIRILFKQFCTKLPHEEFWSWNRQKNCSKVENYRAVPTYFNLKKLIIIITIFLAFFSVFASILSLLDPDTGGKMNADPCGSGSTALTWVFFTLLGIQAWARCLESTRTLSSPHIWTLNNSISFIIQRDTTMLHTKPPWDKRVCKNKNKQTC